MAEENVVSKDLLHTEEEIDLRRYGRILFRRRWAVLSVMVIVVSVVAIYFFRLPTEYTSTSRVVIEQPENQQARGARFDELAAVTGEGGTQKDFYNTQLEILRGYALAKQVVQATGLVHVYKLPKKLLNATEDAQVQYVAGKFQKDVKVEHIKDSQLFDISVKAHDPVLARDITNKLTDLFVKQSIADQLFISKEILEFFPTEAEKLQVETPAGKIEELSRADMAESLPSVANDPLIRQLKAKQAELETTLSTLLKRYKEKHPKVKEIRSSLKFIDERIKLETDNIIKNLKASYASQLQVSNVRVVSPAEVPALPSGPPRLQGIALAFLVSLFLGCGFAFLLDFLDDTIKTQEDIENFVHLPFLGHSPVIRVRGGVRRQMENFLLYCEKEPLSEAAEAFRYIKVAVNFSAPTHTLKSIMVTSAIPGEGKSFVSSNLAVSSAQDKMKVLLIEGDLRHPAIVSHIGGKPSPGLSDFLTGDIPWGAVIQKSPVENLDIVAAGHVPPNPAEILGSYRMEEFMRLARERYDRIVFDSAPVMGVADSLIAGKFMDGVLMVIHAGKIGREIINRSKQRLQETGLKIIGVVLNNVNLSTEEASYKYYGYGYYKRGQKKS